MIQEVVSVDLPVHERLVIKKNRLEPENMTGKEKRISMIQYASRAQLKDSW